MVFQSLAQLPSSVKFKSQLNNSLIVSFCAFKAVLFFFFFFLIKQKAWFYCCLSILFRIYSLGMWQLCSWFGKSTDVHFFWHNPHWDIQIQIFSASLSLSLSLSLSASFHLVGNGLQNKHQMCSLKALLFAACDFDTVPLVPNHIMSATFTFAALTTSQPIDIYWLRWTWASFIRTICKTLEHNHAETHCGSQEINLKKHFSLSFFKMHYI